MVYNVFKENSQSYFEFKRESQSCSDIQLKSIFWRYALIHPNRQDCTCACALYTSPRTTELITFDIQVDARECVIVNVNLLRNVCDRYVPIYYL